MKNIILLILVLLYANAFSQNKVYKKDSIGTNNMTILEQASFIVKNNFDSSVVGNKMPIFTSKDINGYFFLNDTTKKIAFYNFWFISCKPCIDEMPMLNELAREYQDKIDFFAVTFEDSVNLKGFLKKHNFDFRHLIVDRDSLENLGVVSGYPTNVIVVDGTIIYCSHGGTFKESKYYESIINEYYNNYKRILNKAIN